MKQIDQSNSPWGNLSIKACTVLRNAGLMEDPEATKKAIREGYPIHKHRMAGKVTVQEIYQWAGVTVDPKAMKWTMISQRQVVIGGVMLQRSEILAILVAMG